MTNQIRNPKATGDRRLVRISGFGSRLASRTGDKYLEAYRLLTGKEL